MAISLKAITEEELQKARLKHPGFSFETNSSNPVMMYCIIAFILAVLVFLCFCYNKM
jgi:hypothetical protein